MIKKHCSKKKELHQNVGRNGINSGLKLLEKYICWKDLKWKETKLDGHNWSKNKLHNHDL